MIKRKVYSSIAALAVSAVLLLLLIFEEQTSETAREALDAVIDRVLPPLFPYMVISSVIVSLDLLEPIYSLIPTEKLFGLPRCAAQVILCGLLCGFPIGASGAARLYEDGKISRREASVLTALSSHTSPAFLVGSVGVMWGSRAFGAFLYVMQIVFLLTSGVITARSTHRDTSDVPKNISTATPKKSFAEVVCRAVSDASMSCLAITGYIVFFRIAAALLSALIPALSAMFVTVFEFSAGSLLGAQIGGVTGAGVTGFAVGFAGLAVFMQSYNFTSRADISAKCLFILKLAEGIFLGLSAASFAHFHPLSPSVNTFSEASTPSLPRTICVIGILLLTFFVCTYCRKRNYFTHGY